MYEMLKDYRLNKPLTNEDSGFSKWGFAYRDGRKYYIKEFMDPVYPPDGDLIGKERVAKRRKFCAAYEKEKAQIYRAVNEYSDGNLVRIKEFFRFGSRYYVTMDFIEGINPKEVLSLPEDRKILLCKVLAHSVLKLHEAGLTHGDLKISNIIFQKLPSGFVTAKIIDFDTCFWSAKGPKDTEDISGDQVYEAPETLRLSILEEGTITDKIDVFSLGIIFHQIFTGRVPAYDTSSYAYPCEAALNGAVLEPDDNITARMKTIIRSMLLADPDRRADIVRVMEMFTGSGHAEPAPSVSAVQKAAASQAPAAGGHVSRLKKTEILEKMKAADSSYRTEAEPKEKEARKQNETSGPDDFFHQAGAL